MIVLDDNKIFKHAFIVFTTLFIVMMISCFTLYSYVVTFSEKPNLSSHDTYYSVSKENIALGDSTMSLSNGVIENRSYGCRHERGNWVSLLENETENLSCAGAVVDDMVELAGATRAIGENTQRVFITAGSNSFRNNASMNDVVKDLLNITKVVQEKAPDAHIIFVGYTYVPLGKCMNKNTKFDAHYINTLHVLGDYAMKKAARLSDSFFIDNSILTYNICKEDNTYVRLPGTTSGANWHTTLRGHRAIKNNVDYVLNQKNM